MITWMRTMMECRHAVSRVERYLDADPSAPLRASLRRLGDHHHPDPVAVARLQHLVHTIATDEDRE